MNIISQIFNFNVLTTRQPVQSPPLMKQMGIKKNVTIHNHSGKKAWVILAPAPILSVSSIGLDKLGQISFAYSGEYKCQQSPISDKSHRTFDLDSSYIYYTVFFECDNVWKVHFKDVKHDTSVYDINLLPRHVDESVNFDIKPL